MLHEKFHYKSLEEVEKQAENRGIELPISRNSSILFQPLQISGRQIKNRFVYQPMEGCDCASDGGPGELTIRKYKRFAAGGPGIIWFEAVAIVPEGRAQARQLLLTDKNVDSYKRCVEIIKETCLKENGYEPIVIMQETHSGRNSKPNGIPEPVVAYHNPLFEINEPLDNSCVITDDRLKELEEIYGEAAKTANEIGFDGVDVKACHGYLIYELLTAYRREGEYGGSLENRWRFLNNSIRSAQAKTNKEFIVTCRLGVYDGLPYPFGFGTEKSPGIHPDMTEPMKLIDHLHNDLGMEMLNITLGNPYITPHINRPYDNGGYIPEEHPLVGVGRILEKTKLIQDTYPDLNVVCSGLSYLRQFSPFLAAGVIKKKYAQMAGFGREALAYPEFIKELKENGEIDPSKVCVTCGRCAGLLRAGKKTGCVVRDREQYKTT